MPGNLVGMELQVATRAMGVKIPVQHLMSGNLVGMALQVATGVNVI